MAADAPESSHGHSQAVTRRAADLPVPWQMLEPLVLARNEPSLNDIDLL